MNPETAGEPDIAQPMAARKLANYASARGATAYRNDHRTKLHRRWSDRRERALLRRRLRALGTVDTILDVPCGHGRLQDLFAAHCRQLVAADWSPSMLDLSRETATHRQKGARLCRASALALPFHDRALDVVVSIRLSHHLESAELRERHLRELFRVARRAVIVTWFSATSLKNRLRQLRVRLGRKSPKHTLHNDRVVEIAAAAGWQTVELAPLFRIGSGHVLGTFERGPDQNDES